MHARNGTILAGGLLAALLPGLCLAANFRIETEVFLPGEKQPVSKNLTLFADELVYDFTFTVDGAKEVKEIAILDMQQQKFILLDPKRLAKTEFLCNELLKFNDQLQQLADASGKPLQKFAAHPKFTEAYDRQTGILKLTSGVIDYRVVTVKPPANQPDVSTAYVTFADWYTRLNTVQPGSLPPNHRLDLNAVLAKHGIVPTQVERTIFQGNQRGETAQSQHKVDWILNEADRRMISQTATPRVQYKPMAFAQYYVVPEKK